MTTGERWASAELGALRAARFAPGAWRDFLAASLARAAETREARPGLARQARRWSVGGALGAFALREALARRGRGGAPGPVGLAAWCAAEAVMLDWHLGMVEGPAGEPRARLSVADALTLGRAALGPFAAAAPPHAPWFVALLGAAAASDLLDGRAARARARGVTRLGRDLDPICDIAFRAAALRGARRAGWLGRGPAAALAARHAVVVAGGAWHWFARAQRPPAHATRLARLDAPPLFAGLALAALGRPRAGGPLVAAAAAMGAAAALRTARADARRRAT